MTAPPVAFLTACAVDRQCRGDMLLTGAPNTVCTADPQHAISLGDLAVCVRCSEAQCSDRYTVERALRIERWAVLGDGRLCCSEHTAPCVWCEETSPLELMCDHEVCSDCRSGAVCNDCAMEWSGR